jgi:hypothetical protein
LLAERTRLPNLLLGAAEDVVAVGLAMAVISSGRDTG